MDQAKSSIDTAKILTKDAKSIEPKVAQISSVLGDVASNQRTIVAVNREMASAVETLNSDINTLSGGVNRSVVNIQDANIELDALRSTSEQMIGASVKLGVSTADTKYINAVYKVAQKIQSAIVEGIQNIVNEFEGAQKVNEILTLHMGPEFILANISIDFKDDLPVGEVENYIHQLDRQIKTKFVRVKRVFVEAEKRKS